MNVRLDSLEALANTMEKQISLKSNVFAHDKKNSENHMESGATKIR